MTQTFELGQRVEWRNGANIHTGWYHGPDAQWSDWSLVETGAGDTLVRSRLLHSEGALVAEDAELADLAWRAQSYPVGDDEHAARRREQRGPWCDTCKRPAVVSEFYGIQHATAEHPFGVHEDGDHEVTMREWCRVPR